MRGLLGVPNVELFLFLFGHGVRHEVTLWRKRSHVRLVVWCIEEVGKEAFLEFSDTKGVWKGSQRHSKKGKRVNERDVVMYDLQELGAITCLFDGAVLTMIFVNDEITVVALEVVS